MMHTIHLAPIFAAAAMLASVTGMSHLAEAASLGQCFSSQQVFINAMKNEGQHTYATGVTVGSSIGTAMIFANDDGTSGYYLTSDVTDDSPQFLTPGHELCVDNRLKDVTLFDARLSTVPEGAKITEDARKVEQQCRGFNDRCGIHNDVLYHLNRNDMNVMLRATIVDTIESDLARTPGSILTMIGRQDDTPVMVGRTAYMHPGVIGYSTPEGAYRTMTILRDAAYSTYAAKRIERSAKF